MHYIIFDLEWNNTYNYRKKRGFNEIIEIGAVKLDESLKVVDTFKQLIKPQISRRLSTRVKDLTHITMEEIDKNGIPFETAISNFARWSKGDDNVFLSWSESDLYVLVHNFKYFYGVASIDFIKHYADAQRFSQRNIDAENTNQISLQHCAELLDIEFEFGTLHRALEDCYLTAECLKKTFDDEEIKKYIFDCDLDFFEKLVFKPFFIKEEVTDKFDIKNISYNCPYCSLQLKRVSDFRLQNNAFSCIADCEECEKKFYVLLSVKRLYDGIKVSQNISDFKSRNSSEKEAKKEAKAE